MSASIDRVVVVGGGTAGWLTAGRIARRHGPGSKRPVSVTLIESPNIKTIGVGEGTWPTLRESLEAIGVSETDFVRECNAAFKQGGKFVSWTRDDPGEHYYHPFNLPQGAGAITLAAYWDAARANDPSPFADAVDCQSRLCEAGLAPKKITTPEYKALSNYAYHLDTDRFGAFLKTHCVERLGVKHILDDVTDAHLSEDGYIDSLSTGHHGALEGDLFVDCTGFRSLLLGRKLGEPLMPRQDVLFVDHALAMQVPYPDAGAPVACQTIATAQSAGWIWDIGLQTRRGVGHVYSSAHTDHETAERALRAYVRAFAPDAADTLSCRLIKIQNGCRDRFWVKNCVAVGLSAGFLEPLEASAIMLVESSAKLLAERLPA
ncbi:MAG: tryptophan 7-halogenase, partial [Caulobacterales bacterium]|nr:tryptophan 7-halogenase [Caulobacterales bacterium]